MSPRPTLPHLLRVTHTVLEFAQLVAAMRQDRLQVGWLEWSPGQRPAADPALMPAAGAAGVPRAVRVDAETTVAVKRRRGAPVLRDVLREGFRGATLVLVQVSPETESEVSAIDAPLLEPILLDSAPTRWRIVPSAGAALNLTTEALVARLRRPHPFAKEQP